MPIATRKLRNTAVGIIVTLIVYGIGLVVVMARRTEPGFEELRDFYSGVLAFISAGWLIFLAAGLLRDKRWAYQAGLGSMSLCAVGSIVALGNAASRGVPGTDYLPPAIFAFGGIAASIVLFVASVELLADERGLNGPSGR